MTDVRDAGGRFGKGNKGGPGRRKNLDWSQWKRDNEADLMTLADKLLAAAIEGDMSACKLLLDRIWPTQNAANEALREEIADLQMRLEEALRDSAA